jgi:hypothetical protein
VASLTPTFLATSASRRVITQTLRLITQVLAIACAPR